MKKVVRLLLRSLTLLVLVLMVSAATPDVNICVSQAEPASQSKTPSGSSICKFMPAFDEIVDVQDINGSNVNRFLLIFCRNSIELSLLNIRAFSPDEEAILTNAYLNYGAEDYIKYLRQVDIPNSRKANGTILLWKLDTDPNVLYIVTLVKGGMGYVFTPRYLLINKKEAQSGN